jgi:hypothetical protein
VNIDQLLLVLFLQWQIEKPSNFKRLWGQVSQGFKNVLNSFTSGFSSIFALTITQIK